jgi:myosin-15
LLPFRRGDLISIKERDVESGWLRGEIGERAGWFPKESVQILFAPQGRNRDGKPLLNPYGYLFGGDDTATDGTRPAASIAIPSMEGTGTMGRRNTLRGLIKGTFGKKAMEALVSSEGEQAEDQRLYLQQRRDTSKFTMLEWAKNNYRMELSRAEVLQLAEKTKRRGSLLETGRTASQDSSAMENWQEIVKVLKFSKEPLKYPLNKLIQPAEAKLATDNFMAVMAFMGDFPIKGVSDVQHVQNIVGVALKRETLRDEVYCQIIKQCTNNRSPKADSLRRGWDLMILCCSSFAPSAEFAPFLNTFLAEVAENKSREFHEMASQCVKRLRRIRKFGQRKLPPGAAEVQSVKTNSPMSLRINFPDNTSRMFIVDSCTTADDVIARASSKMQLHNADEFALAVAAPAGASVPIMNDDYMLDVMLAGERMVQSVAQSSIRRTGSLPTAPPVFQILFLRKLWISRRVPQSDLVISIIYHQILGDLMNNNLVTSQEQSEGAFPLIAKLGALQLLSNPAADKSLMSTVDFFRSLVPSLVYGRLDPAAWRASILQQLKSLGELDESEARRQFILAAEGLTLYGCSFFEFKACSLARLATGGYLCVSVDGVKIVDKLTRTPSITSGFEEIVSCQYDDSEFSIKLGDLLSSNAIRFVTPEGFTIGNLIAAYIRHHMNSRAREPQLPPDAFAEDGVEAPPPSLA